VWTRGGVSGTDKVARSAGGAEGSWVEWVGLRYDTGSGEAVSGFSVVVVGCLDLGLFVFCCSSANLAHFPTGRCRWGVLIFCE